MFVAIALLFITIQFNCITVYLGLGKLAFSSPFRVLRSNWGISQLNNRVIAIPINMLAMNGLLVARY